jgi:hypothetical protein
VSERFGFRGLAFLLALLGFGAVLPGKAAEPPPAELRNAVQRLLDANTGLDLALGVALPDREVVFGHRLDESRPAASAIKAFVALDLLHQHPDRLEDIPAGIGFLLLPGSHPAFSGFRPEALSEARRDLEGLSWLDLARVMMGRDSANNETYNAACNLLMIKLGGPEAIDRRMKVLGFEGVDLNRYMFQWDGGDNRATPAVLLRLYTRAAAGSLVGLTPEGGEIFRSLLLEGEDGQGKRYGKMGTLYPRPMIRVRAGWYERGGTDIVYAIMGTMDESTSAASADAFVFLLAAVDTLAAIVRDVP